MEENLEHGFETGGESTDSGVYDVDAIVDMLGGSGEDAGEVDAKDDAESMSEADADDGAEDSSDVEVTSEAQPEESPEVPMPEGWDDAMWQGLAPEVRSAVHAREQNYSGL